MKRMRILTLVLIGGLTFSSITPAYAANNSVLKGTESQSILTDDSLTKNAGKEEDSVDIESNVLELIKNIDPNVDLTAYGFMSAKITDQNELHPGDIMIKDAVLYAYIDGSKWYKLLGFNRYTKTSVSFSRDALFYRFSKITVAAPDMIYDIKGMVGSRLSEMSLPSGWTWELDLYFAKAGNYRCRAVYDHGNPLRYNSVTAEIPVTILKKSSYLEVPASTYEVSKISEMKLSDIRLPEGWEWKHNDKLLSAGIYHETAVFNGNIELSYPVTDIDITVSVSDREEPADTYYASYFKGLSITDIMLPDHWRFTDLSELKPGTSIRHALDESEKIEEKIEEKTTTYKAQQVESYIIVNGHKIVSGREIIMVPVETPNKEIIEETEMEVYFESMIEAESETNQETGQETEVDIPIAETVSTDDLSESFATEDYEKTSVIETEDTSRTDIGESIEKTDDTTILDNADQQEYELNTDLEIENKSESESEAETDVDEVRTLSFENEPELLSNGIKEKDITIVVDKGQVVQTMPDSSYTIAYGQKLSDIILPDGWDFSESDQIPSAGVHTFKVVFKAADTEHYNYIDTVITVTVNVSKAKADIEIPESIYTLRYGSAKTTNGILLPDGWAFEQIAELPLGTQNLYAIYVKETENESIPVKRKKVTVNVLRGVPEHAISMTIKCHEGTQLKSIKLPVTDLGYYQMDSLGYAHENMTYYCSFIPYDAKNYVTISQIPINIINTTESSGPMSGEGTNGFGVSVIINGTTISSTTTGGTSITLPNYRPDGNTTSGNIAPGTGTGDSTIEDIIKPVLPTLTTTDIHLVSEKQSLNKTVSVVSDKMNEISESDQESQNVVDGTVTADGADKDNYVDYGDDSSSSLNSDEIATEENRESENEESSAVSSDNGEEKNFLLDVGIIALILILIGTIFGKRMIKVKKVNSESIADTTTDHSKEKDN